MVQITTFNPSGYARSVTADCDGCGKKLVAGDPLVTGISSCCGGCDRSICAECVRMAAHLLQQFEAQAALPKAVVS
jgi:hypothetical protein